MTNSFQLQKNICSIKLSHNFNKSFTLIIQHASIHRHHTWMESRYELINWLVGKEKPERPRMRLSS